MQLPIVEPAPVVLKYADEFRPLFKDCRQFNHFRNYLTGLIVLNNKSMSNIAQCIVESADKTNISRFLSASPWAAVQPWSELEWQHLCGCGDGAYLASGAGGGQCIGWGLAIAQPSGAAESGGVGLSESSHQYHDLSQHRGRRVLVIVFHCGCG